MSFDNKKLKLTLLSLFLGAWIFGVGQLGAVTLRERTGEIYRAHIDAKLRFSHRSNEEQVPNAYGDCRCISLFLQKVNS